MDVEKLLIAVIVFSFLGAAFMLFMPESNDSLNVDISVTNLHIDPFTKTFSAELSITNNTQKSISSSSLVLEPPLGITLDNDLVNLPTLPVGEPQKISVSGKFDDLAANTKLTIFLLFRSNDGTKSSTIDLVVPAPPDVKLKIEMKKLNTSPGSDFFLTIQNIISYSDYPIPLTLTITYPDDFSTPDGESGSIVLDLGKLPPNSSTGKKSFRFTVDEFASKRTYKFTVKLQSGDIQLDKQVVYVVVE